LADKPVRFAIVGMGMGHVRAKECKQTAGAELALLCDMDQERLAKNTAEFEVPGTTSYEEVLNRDDIEAVMILTPSGMHAEMGIAAAKAGKHVISTKPLDVSLAAIDKLIQVCRKHKVLLAVDFQERYSDMVQRVRAGLDRGVFGELILLEARLKWSRGDAYYEGWHGTWRMDGGGSLMNQTVHLIDQLQWFGGDIEQVVGRMKVCTHKIETEDLGLALVDFKNGAKGVIVGTTTFPESRTYDMEIHGSKFGAAWGSVNKEYFRSLPEGAELPPRPADAPKNIFEDVVGALRHGRKVLVDGQEGRKSVELILSVYKSALTGKPVKLPLKTFKPPVPVSTVQ
jgi:UDP-N-acetyl-2-amino-2-deoxyglucuronate dehydrogenase